MIAPTLLVGLGGTGSKIICRVAKMVNEEQKRRIGFAVFDTDINELREISNENPGIEVIQTSTKLSVGEYLDIDTHARDTWFPVNAILNSKTLTEGAGQVRAISRLAFDTAIRAGNMEPLHKAIEDLYKLEDDQSEQALRVIIVSSLAGGTGSGLILPVALYIKHFLAMRFQQSANITRGFFILPEVFYKVIPGQSERNNLKCNAYATLRELDAFLMKGDATLPDKFAKTVRLEFPRVGSDEFEEYNVRPYDFCFLFDAQNTEGKQLNSFNQYLDHAANCIFSQSIGPMNKRSNSSEDNTIRDLCAKRGRNRYAGAGSSMLIYPVEDVKDFISLNWAKECISDRWLTFDRLYKKMCIKNSDMRSKGLNVKDLDPSSHYIETVEQMANDKNPFALSITNACAVFDESGLSKTGEKWEDYVDALKKKIKSEASSGQVDLDGQKNQARTSISEIEGGRDSWESFQNAFFDMERYKAMIVKRSEDTAHIIGYTIFEAQNDSVTKDKLKYQLETYLRDENGNFMHPNAVRYFLYKTLELLKAERRVIDKKNQEANELFDRFETVYFDDKSTEDTIETVADLTNRKLNFFNALLGVLDGQQKDLKDAYNHYMNIADEYRVNSILVSVLEEGINYVGNLCAAFQIFFLSFEGKVPNIERRISDIAKKYDHLKGTAARFVCASPKCLTEMLKKMPYTGSSITIDSQLADDIYCKVRKYSMLNTKPDPNDKNNSNYFSEIFEQGILGYFKDALMERHNDDIDMDIISALEEEARLEKGKYDDEMNKYVKDAIENTRALSNPFIERPLGEQRAPIKACALNKKLNQKDGSARSMLIESELMDQGGVEDDDIDKNMILFYQSIYGLCANRLSKFAPGGEYYKAYFELITQIKPKSDKTPVITPHIDKTWHIVSALPDLDDQNQKMQEHQVYKAFMYGLIFESINYEEISKGKYLYKLYIKGGKSEEFVVSNKTPCDNYYEVLDALMINPVIVKSILESVERRLERERNATEKAMFENSLLKTKLDTLEIEEYGRKDVTIFDLVTLLKVSAPSADFDKLVGEDIMAAILEEVYTYIGTLVAETELNSTYSAFILEQYKKFNANLDWYFSRRADNYSGYINDLIRVALEDLEEKELLKEYDEIRAMSKSTQENKKTKSFQQ